MNTRNKTTRTNQRNSISYTDCATEWCPPRAQWCSVQVHVHRSREYARAYARSGGWGRGGGSGLPTTATGRIPDNRCK